MTTPTDMSPTEKPFVGLDALRRHVVELGRLLNSPEDALYDLTWIKAYSQRMREIADFWRGGGPSKLDVELKPTPETLLVEGRRFSYFHQPSQVDKSVTITMVEDASGVVLFACNWAASELEVRAGILWHNDWLKDVCRRKIIQMLHP
jgi:hypothetical protein